MKKITTITTICLLGLMLSVSQSAELKSEDGMMKDDMNESMDPTDMKMKDNMMKDDMKKDDIKMKDDMMEKSESMK